MKATEKILVVEELEPIIEDSLKLRSGERRDRDRFMERIIRRLRDRPLPEVSELPIVQERHLQYRQEEDRMIEQIRRDAVFLPQDDNRELIVIDLTKHNRRPYVVKNLAYLIYPDAKGVIEVKNRFRREVKTNDLAFSMSVSLNLNRIPHNKDVGEIMRILNIGDGHPGAGAGTMDCASKDEMEKKKEEILTRTFQVWSEQ
jgi:hypothetical protein